MSATPTGVEIRGLRFAHGRTTVLDGLDLTVPAGAVTAVVGPSGCGKTTLLRLVAGFERPTSGEVRLGGVTVAGPGTHVPPHRRHVGIVPQEGALFPHLDVAGNVRYALSGSRGSRAGRAAHRTRVAELLALVGLDGLERRLPRELSGGQQQRVAVARALASRPDVVLLDEPFASLDAQTRGAVRSRVRDALAAEGATAILVTHDREEALSLADHAAVVRAGRVVQAGTPAEVYDAPADVDVARTLGPASLLPILHVPVPVGPGSSVTCALGTLPVGSRHGDARRVLLRPEQVSAGRAAPGDAAPGDGGARPGGVVTSADYHGGHTVLTVRAGDDDVLASTSDRTLRVGDRVDLVVTGPVHLV